ncbi:MAG TPA: hypothetical protein VL359_13920, partial [bacterium]|nr:hypothetical protein [bacterium]
LRLLGRGRHATQTRRLIFQFTDRQIEQILRHRIVFCTQDTLLVQFILTCMRIDHLEDGLFTMSTPEFLPERGIDLLFYGPGYEAEDFTDRVKRKRIVQFADDAFMERLAANEQLKARIKQALTEGERLLQQKRPLLEQAVIQAQAARDKVRTGAEALAKAREEQRALRKRMADQGERLQAAKGDLQLLEAHLAEVDERFKSLRERLSQAYAGTADGEQAIQARAQLMADLQEELTSLNRELARLMMIKGFKDAGQHVSHSSQERVLRSMELRERIPPSRPLRKVVVADDGSVPARAIHRAFTQAAQAHLKLDESAQESSTLKRLAARLEAEQPAAYDLAVIISDQPADNYEELRTLVRRLRRRLPKAYPLVFVPFGEMEALPRESPARRNIVALQERCTLVNTSILDYTLPRAMLRLLQRKAPRA